MTTFVLVHGAWHGGWCWRDVAGRLQALVYLDAFVPADGQCLRDLAPPERVAAMHRDADERGDGWKEPPMPASIWLDDPAQQAWVEPKVTPHPLRCFTDPLPLPGAWQTVGRKMHILAGANDPSPFPAIHKELSSDSAWLCRRIAGPHDLMISHPAETVALLLEAAG